MSGVWFQTSVVKSLISGDWYQTSDTWHDRCLLSDVLWQVSVIRCLMTGVCYQMCDVRCLLWDVWWQVSDIRRLMSGVCYETSDDRCLLSDLMSGVCYQTSHIRCLLSDVWWQVSVIRQLISDVWWQVSVTSDVWCLISDVWHKITQGLNEISIHLWNWLTNKYWPAPNVGGFIGQLVEHRTGIASSWVQTLLKSWIFFSGFFTQLHKLCSLRRSFLHFHFISFPQFIHDLFQISLTKNIIILINAKKPMMAFFTLLTVNVCSCVPWNASIRWMTPPLADSKIILPSELNFTPVHSMLGSFWIWKVENGPCENRWKKKESAQAWEIQLTLSKMDTFGTGTSCPS